MSKNKAPKTDPVAKDALSRFKQELADELGVFHSQSKLSDSYDKNPSLGDYLVEQMIKTQQNKRK